MADTGIHQLLDPRAVRLTATAPGRDDAIRICGEALVATGAVDPAYVETMLEREQSVSTYVGEGVAIPHGTLEGKDHVHRDALSFVRFPRGVDWGGQPVTVAIGIAARDGGHVAILAELASILLDPARAAALRAATDPDEVLLLLTPAPDPDQHEDSPA